MFDKRTNLSTHVVDEAKNYFGDRVYETVIPRNIRLAESQSLGQNIIDYDPTSKGAKPYINLAREFIKKGE